MIGKGKKYYFIGANQVLLLAAECFSLMEKSPNAT